MAQVPLTPLVLDWAILESGFTYQEVADTAKIELNKLRAVIAGKEQLNFTQFNKIQSKLSRPSATFFLPEPPSSTSEDISYRVGPEGSRSRSPAERVAIRNSLQIQDLLVAVYEETRVNLEPLPRYDLQDDPAQAATETKKWLEISDDEHRRHRSPAQMFGALRAQLGYHRIFALKYSMGAKGARGFVLHHEVAPIIGISTSVWTYGVRVYTLLHELGHLTTRDSTSCGDTTAKQRKNDPAERWAEMFAANFLMPESSVRTALLEMTTGPIEKKVVRVSNVHHTSRQAAFIRLIEMGMASWNDYHDYYSQAHDRKKRGGRPSETPRTRGVLRREMLGDAAFELIQAGLYEDILSPLEVERVLGASLEELLHTGQ